jgi:hypothetical protein
MLDHPMARRSGVGRLFIVRFRPATDPVNAEYLLTFGPPSPAEAALNLGSVRGLDGLTDVLRAGRVPVGEIEKAWRVLAVEFRHQVPNVTLTRALIQMLKL